MDFYVSWSHSDAIYCDYFPGCPMLISAIPDNHRPLKRFKTHPTKLIVDSGALFYASHTTPYRLRDVFAKQLQLIEDASPAVREIRLVHFDQPMLDKSTLSKQYEAMERTLYNAYEYFTLFQDAALPAHLTAVGVIQGFDIPSIRYAVHELKKIGYTRFAVGSLIGRHPEQQIQFITEAASLVGTENLHVLGVTGIPQVKQMLQLGIASIDSTKPTMAAAFFQIFYSNPFRTYFLRQSRVKDRNIRIDTPLPCDCPVCQETPESLLIPTPRIYMKLRSIHNYFHWMKTIELLQQEQLKEDDDALLAETDECH